MSGKRCADQVGVGVAQALQAGVDLAAAAACGDDGGEFLLGGAADAHAGSVVEQDVEGFDVVDGLAAHQRVDAAGVVADHSAQRAAAVRRGIGREGEFVLLGFGAQRVEDDSGLDARTRVRRSSSTTPCMYFEKSRTTATLQVWPATLVPPPRERTAASNSRQAATVAITSAASLGTTRPMGTWR